MRTTLLLLNGCIGCEVFFFVKLRVWKMSWTECGLWLAAVFFCGRLIDGVLFLT